MGVRSVVLNPIVGGLVDPVDDVVMLRSPSVFFLEDATCPNSYIASLTPFTDTTGV